LWHRLAPWQLISFLAGICWNCLAEPEGASADLLSRKRVAEQRLVASHAVCTACTNGQPSERIRCESLDCLWFFERKKAERSVEDLGVDSQLIGAILDWDGRWDDPEAEVERAESNSDGEPNLEVATVEL
jgi:DNA polymerase zeta